MMWKTGKPKKYGRYLVTRTIFGKYTVINIVKYGEMDNFGKPKKVCWYAICVSDETRRAVNGDLQKIQQYIDNIKEYYLGKTAEVADLTDKRWEAQDRILRLTYAVTAGGVHEIMKYKDPDKEVEE